MANEAYTGSRVDVLWDSPADWDDLIWILRRLKRDQEIVNMQLIFTYIQVRLTE